MCERFCDCQMLCLVGSYNDQFYYIGSVLLYDRKAELYCAGGVSAVTVTPADAFTKKIKIKINDYRVLTC